MRRFLLACVLLLASVVPMQAQALVAIRTACASGCDTTDTFQTDASVTVTIPGTTTGNLIVVVTQGQTANRTISSITCGGTFTLGHREDYSAFGSEAPGSVNLSRAIATSSVTSCVVALSGATTGGNDRVTVLEFSGAAATDNEEGTSTGAVNNVATGTHTAASVTPTSGSVVFIGAFTLGATGGTVGLDAAFTAAFATTTTQGVGYLIQADNTAQDFVSTSSTSRQSVVALMAIEMASGGVVPCRGMMMGMGC